MQPPKATLSRLFISLGIAAAVVLALALPSMLDEDSDSETSAVVIGEQGDAREPEAQAKKPNHGRLDAKREKRKRGDASRRGDAPADQTPSAGSDSPPVGSGVSPAPVDRDAGVSLAPPAADDETEDDDDGTEDDEVRDGDDGDNDD